MFTETLIVAAMVALGLIVGGKAIITGIKVARRPPHHSATHTGASPISLAVDVEAAFRPPE